MLILMSLIAVIFFTTTIGLGMMTFRLSKLIFSLEDQVEESLDIIDGCYRRISEASQVPVLYDEPVIKGVVKDIATSRDALLVIANKITNFSSDNDAKNTNQ